jgi:AhpD family alkylhydroperoxidase
MDVPQILRNLTGRNSNDSNNLRPFGKKTYQLGAVLRDIATLLPRSGDLLRIYLFKDMSPALREAIMVAVARANECRYCSFAHREWALSAGLEADELAQVEHGEGAKLDRATTLAVQYARALVRQEFGRVPLELEASLDSTFSLRERRDIETVARMMTIANLSGNTVDALLARLSGNAVEDSRLPDELVLSAVFAAVAPVVVLLLGSMRGRSPLAMLNAFREFSEDFEREADQPIDSTIESATEPDVIDAAFKRVEVA